MRFLSVNYIIKISEVNSQEPSKRRRDLLAKISILIEAYPNNNIQKIREEDFSNDQLEIMYLKWVQELQSQDRDREKARENDSMKNIANKFMPILVNTLSNARQSTPSDKPDIIIHHIIKFEK